MNIEEIDKWLDNEYGVSYTRLEELHDFLIEQNMKYQDKNDNLQQENQELKKQLEYLRSGEYYNQLRFENEMLQQVVDTNGVPSEVYDYIDCTHRNTELLEENQELKKQLENYKKLGFKHLQDKNNNLETQQKEFIKWLEDEKNRLARECSHIYEDSLGHTRLVNEDIFDEVNDILQKYKEITGE